MISHRCRYKGRGSVLMRVFTSSSVRWAAARVTLAISSLFSFRSSPPLFYHSTRIRIKGTSMQIEIKDISRSECMRRHGREELLVDGPVAHRANGRRGGTGRMGGENHTDNGSCEREWNIQAVEESTAGA